jgi:hypothetical protein
MNKKQPRIRSILENQEKLGEKKFINSAAAKKTPQRSDHCGGHCDSQMRARKHSVRDYGAANKIRNQEAQHLSTGIETTWRGAEFGLKNLQMHSQRVAIATQQPLSQKPGN